MDHDYQLAANYLQRAVQLDPGDRTALYQYFGALNENGNKADVKITTEDWGQADMLIRNSRALAEAGVFPELVANARISEGHRLFRRGDPVGARLEYNAVLKEARRIGVRKLETRTLTALARLALAQKDVDSAHSYALRSLRLATLTQVGQVRHVLCVLGL